MRYAPGKVPARPLPAAPSRPTIQQQVGGTRPMGTGTPQIPPQNINPIRPGVRPMGPAPMTGGPKPAPTIQQPTAGVRPMGGAPTMGGGLPAPGMGGRPGLPMMKKGGKVSSASKRADGIATKGKTKGKIV